MTDRSSVKVIVKSLAVDTVYMSLLFILIFGIAIVISQGIIYLDEWLHVGSVILNAIMLVKYIMLGLDVILFIIALYSNTLSFLRELRLVCKDFNNV